MTITVKDLMSSDVATSLDGKHWEPTLPPPPFQWHTRLSNAWAVLYGRAVAVRQTEASDIEPRKVDT